MTNITVTGRVGSDPELRYTGTGTPVLNFQLAEDHRAKNPQTGAWESTGTTWRAVSVWARGLMDPEYLHSVLAKGQHVTVQGSERLREWEGRDGAPGKTLELSASLVAVPLYPPRDASAAPAQGQHQAQPAPAPAQQAQQQVSAWPTAPAGGFSQQTDPWAAQPGANDSPPF